MGLENTIDKLDKYFKRLDKGKAQKIKPAHVDELLRKLETKAAKLEAELAETTDDAKRQRLESKLTMVHEQQKRATWLAEQIRDA
ncbi:hypothetical protein [Actibacterium sp. XHP0104]|uniref:hypothetical protein n=1 Tax=Actibacterium sp. XHP0104 TaxID=2984335 RepID=UPI0021E97455|nr:hypothetical protein [Actibacterium sp. XHP0104]MCV2882978.1 hypothetical protein [Actibacterium sp. XHP0104]